MGGQPNQETGYGVHFMEWFTDLGKSTIRPQYCHLGDTNDVWNVNLPKATQVIIWSAKREYGAFSTVGYAGRHPNEPWLNYMVIRDLAEAWAVARELCHVMGKNRVWLLPSVDAQAVLLGMIHEHNRRDCESYPFLLMRHPEEHLLKTSK
jgi:hypothetical protein